MALMASTDTVDHSALWAIKVPLEHQQKMALTVLMVPPGMQGPRAGRVPRDRRAHKVALVRQEPMPTTVPRETKVTLDSLAAVEDRVPRVMQDRTVRTVPTGQTDPRAPRDSRDLRVDPEQMVHPARTERRVSPELLVWTVPRVIPVFRVVQGRMLVTDFQGSAV
jgi:hypothetical protein